MPDKDRSRRGGIVGPVILIALGVVFLLNNLGVLDWSVWELLLRLWPILLIATGLDLILGWRSVWGSLVAVLLTAAVLVVALWLSQSGIPGEAAGRTEEIVQPLEDVKSADIVINPAIGSIRLEALDDSVNLVEGTVSLGRGEELARDFSVEDDAGSLTLRTEATSFGPFAVGWIGHRVWDLQLAPGIPLRLTTNLGMGRTDLDLTGMSLDSVNVDQGIGQALVTLPREGAFEVRIEGAIGQTVVVIPEGLEARVRLDTGLAARQLPDDFDCQEDVCISPGYEKADEPVELVLGQAIGNLVVRH